LGVTPGFVTGPGVTHCYHITKTSLLPIEEVVKHENTPGESCNNPHEYSECLHERSECGVPRILVVEDEIFLRELMQQLLVDAGYEVGIAASAEEAIQLANDSLENFDLVITDVIMPGMDGNQLFQKLKDHNARLKVLFMSGYTSDVVKNRGLEGRGTRFIQKPFKLHGILDVVTEMLAD
jgi:CheY-like chemotaxis protein